MLWVVTRIEVGDPDASAAATAGKRRIELAVSVVPEPIVVLRVTRIAVGNILRLGGRRSGRRSHAPAGMAERWSTAARDIRFDNINVLVARELMARRPGRRFVQFDRYPG